jgi:hypothetical protein
MMQIIHFTEGATDRLEGFQARHVRSVPLADGSGDTRLTCFHLSPKAHILDPPITHSNALLVVSGRVTVLFLNGGRAFLSAGVGVVIDAGDRYSIESEKGAIIIAVECKELTPTECAISTPERIMGQRWPGEHDETDGADSSPTP